MAPSASVGVRESRESPWVRGVPRESATVRASRERVGVRVPVGVTAEVALHPSGLGLPPSPPVRRVPAQKAPGALSPLDPRRAGRGLRRRVAPTQVPSPCHAHATSPVRGSRVANERPMAQTLRADRCPIVPPACCRRTLQRLHCTVKEVVFGARGRRLRVVLTQSRPLVVARKSCVRPGDSGLRFAAPGGRARYRPIPRRQLERDCRADASTGRTISRIPQSATQELRGGSRARLPRRPLWESIPPSRRSRGRESRASARGRPSLERFVQQRAWRQP